MRVRGGVATSLRGGGEIHRCIHLKNCTIVYEDIVTFENLLEAWNDFVSGKRKRIDVNEFAQHLSDNLFDILDELKNESYVHGVYEEYVICDTKKRVIHKASVRDRVVHRLIYNTLYGYFDKRYIYDSYSCRIGKGTHKAQARFRHFVNIVSKNYTKPCYVLKFDIKKCFASIDTKILKKIIDWHIEDGRLKNLVYKVIGSFEDGLPLGNLTSQLFINIYLNELDWYVKQTLKCSHYLRYADDIVIISHNKEELETIYNDLQFFLKQELHLTTHKKVISSIYSGIDILGSVFFAKYERLRRSTKRRKKFRELYNSQ
ncbi:reverse transcriptase/maturase family protein [Candidatus Gracilibacteria bacterium]|nr:reverse transcriptase/maturase family protein [Candidatus Gracilibacteria bacterium]